MTRRRGTDRGISTGVVWATCLALSAGTAHAAVPASTGRTADSASASFDSTIAGHDPAPPDSMHVAAAFPALLPPAPPARLRLPAESWLLLEIGQRTDVTNELYIDYGDAFIDSTAVGNDARW